MNQSIHLSTLHPYFNTHTSPSTPSLHPLSNKHTLFYIITRRRAQLAIRERSTSHRHSTAHCANAKKATVSLNSAGYSCTCVNPITFPLLLSSYARPAIPSLQREAAAAASRSSSAPAAARSPSRAPARASVSTKSSARSWELSVIPFLSLPHYRTSSRRETTRRRSESGRRSAGRTSDRRPRWFYASRLPIIRTASSRRSFRPTAPSGRSRRAAD